jgi:tetratricopeptide (TPR) repeat protein
MPRDELSSAVAAEDEDSESVDSLLREAVAISEPSSRTLTTLGLMSGDVLGDRFVVEGLAGSGGMGAIYRGKDLRSGEAVAIKVMASTGSGDANRFAQEAIVLADLSHRSIVRYIAHGTTPHGAQFLAMEWLEGENLAQRLARRGLTAEESIDLVRHVADALAFAHDKGIVHRDVKPSNIYLCSSDTAQVKILDFGIARLQQNAEALTKTGAMLGTVGYMAPEQAMGAADVDARADIFALGSVLFECLTGLPAFYGQHGVAVLAKVLCGAAPLVSALKPELMAFDTLVARLLAKERANRPAHGRAVLAVLDEFAGQAQSTIAVSSGETQALTAAERKITSVILAEALGSPTAKTLTPEQAHADWAELEKIAATFGAAVAPLASGALVFVMSGHSVASDQAKQAAACALGVRVLLPELRVVLATGWADSVGPLPVGPIIDTAARLLRAPESAILGGDGIIIDEVTAGLLSSRFEMRENGAHTVLIGERAEYESMRPLPGKPRAGAGVEQQFGLRDAARLLMGKPTPLVGRDKELGLLELTLRECIDDGVARSVLVTAPPGIGKSRLGSELLARADAAGRVRVLFARAEPTAAGSALSLTQKLIRYAGGLQKSDPADVQQLRIRSYLDELEVPAEDSDRLAEFLGEIVDAPTDRPASPFLRAARNDPAAMREQIRRTFEAWIAAESRAHPVLIVLEDLHWGDLASVNYLRDAVRSLANRPLMLLALARPEVHVRFPRLWEGAELQVVRLGGLTPRAADRLIRVTLGNDLASTTVSRIVELADGNAFYLEELIRRVANGGSELPETVLAMAQSRLEQLEPEARRVLRAASVFGDTCWSGGVAALLGENASGTAWLERLSDEEILVRSQASDFAGQQQYVFRHTLLHDAAYAALTEEDRTLAHRIAGDWLERGGEKTARVLADHFERGGAIDRALPWIVRAAEAAFEANDPSGAIALSERGLGLGTTGRERGILLTLQAAGKSWNATPTLIPPLLEALDLFPEGDPYWWQVITLLMGQAAAMGRLEQAARYAQMALAAPVTAGLSGPRGVTVWLIVTGLERLDQDEPARAMLSTLEQAARQDPNCDPMFTAWLDIARSSLWRGSTWDAHVLEQRLLSARAAVTKMEQQGTELGLCVATSQLATVSGTVGCFDDAIANFKRCLELAGPAALQDHARIYFAWYMLRRSFAEEARDLLTQSGDGSNVDVLELRRIVLAEAYVREERWEEALEEAMPCRAGSSAMIRRWAESVLARGFLGHGDLAAASFALDRAFAESALHSSPDRDSALWLARVQVLHALGNHTEACSILSKTRDRILETVAGFQDAEIRRAFMSLESIASVLALAQEWLIAP